MRSTRIPLILCLMLFASPLAADWTRIGPDGGSVAQIAAAPSRPAVVYAGLGVGGVYRSADRGRTWTFAGEGLIDEPIHDLAVDPRDPNRVYAATNEGLFRSADGGASWRRIGGTDLGGPDFRTVLEVEIHPRQPAVLLATHAGSLFRSTNGGRTWTTEPGWPELVLSLAASPVRPGLFWAGLAGGGLLKSVDSGRTWTAANGGLPAGADILDIAVDPHAADTLYAAAGGASPGLFKSTDGGATWLPSQDGLGSSPLRDVAVDPGHPLTVYALTEEQLFRSLNGGVSWNLLPGTGMRGRPQIVAPLRSGVLAGTQTGLFLSTDQGATWRASQAGLTATPVTSLALDGQDPLRIYAVSYLTGLYKTREGDASWRLLGDPIAAQPFGGLTGPVAVHPADPETVYAGVPLHIAKSENGGRRWTVHSTESCLQPSRIEIDPLDPATLYMSGFFVTSGCFDDPEACSLFRSRDAGQTWTCIGEGLPTAGGSLLEINPVTSALYSTAFTDVWTSTDRGDTWTRLAQGLIPSSFAASHLEEGTLWVANVGGVGTSRDNGQTWTYSLRGLPRQDWIMHLAPHPADPAVIYAGTNAHGVYRSADRGATWVRLGPWPEGLRLRAGIVPDPRDPSVVYAGTDGGGVLRYEP